MSWEAWGDPPGPYSIDCPQCGGDGELPDDGTNDGECDMCGGTGEVDAPDDYYEDDV